MRIPVTDDEIHFSPKEITKNGITNSANANARIAALYWPKERSAPRCQAIGSRMAAPSATRPKATTIGESSCTDSLMKKYGSPQMMPSAAKAPQPRQLTVRSPRRPIALHQSYQGQHRPTAEIGAREAAMRCAGDRAPHGA